MNLLGLVPAVVAENKTSINFKINFSLFLMQEQLKVRQGREMRTSPISSIHHRVMEILKLTQTEIKSEEVGHFTHETS